MTTKYFKNIRTAEELKKAYRDFAKKLHPDMPTGNAEEFKAMQNEYEKLWETLKNIHMNKDGETYVHETDEKASEFMDIINELLKMDGVNVEVCGSWVWATGNTKPYKDALKKLKFAFSPKKSAWYYHKGTYIKKSGNNYSMDNIRKMWGSTSYGTGKADKEDEKALLNA